MNGQIPKLPKHPKYLKSCMDYIKDVEKNQKICIIISLSQFVGSERRK